MKYFLDAEFIEGFRKPLFGKKRWGIDLISIGVVCEDGREYYAVSTDFKEKKANEWVSKNVIPKLPPKYEKNQTRFPSGAILTTNVWKSNKDIKNNLLCFFGCDYEDGMIVAPSGIEVYGYYADYDWVLLASLFGTMMDLPTGFPMYCRDLKQTLDEKLSSRWMIFSKRMKFGIVDTDKHQHTLKEVLDKVKAHPKYPKQENEHNALDDAKWNYKLYQFIQTL